MFNPKTVPVPGIRKGRRGYRYLRRISTTQERRMAFTIDAEPAPRGSRSIRNIPTSWDDLNGCWQKTWKVFGKRRKAWDR